APPPTPSPVARIDPEPAPDPAPMKAEPEREPDRDPAVVAPVRPGKPGSRPAHASPKPVDRTPGTLTLSASVPARVSVDGSPPTPAPLEAVELAPGVHRVVLTNPGLGLSRALEVTIRPGKLLTQAVAVGTGELNVNVTPWAEVWIDGHKAGVTPLAARPIAEGAHRVRLVNPSGEKTVSIAVAPGQSVSLQERLP
ncbi:MAG: PEGA domain-containing protein, partial [Myxococcaceae bacterium]|nr:PEGA domain-containing protein [Myxococcaceae bacterium]